MRRQKLNFQKELNLPSSIDEFSYKGDSFYIKRDDTIHSKFSGNKARKLYYYLQTDFPKINKIISYGSNQSNAMYSMSELANMKNWDFDYYVDHIPSYLKDNPQGNYLKALNNGMNILIKNEESINIDNNTLFIEEGARGKEAEYGIKILAKEITEWQESNNIKDLKVFLPSGTGTTALYLQKHLKYRVYTTPCVGDEVYLKKQFSMLEKDTKQHPTILNTEKKYHFGKLYKEFYAVYKELKNNGIEFDLLYDPKGWIIVSLNPDIFTETTLYIHQGGLIGNESMLPRYERKY
ncbi:pyridoxal phosphate-dependent deaminase, putative [hydrothermal vent metagenome]|uniref:Pyridoxal phosphate-dependent deaminase, putative n=1 Tax=hydrothermal vent metagenome TaxID=652676 RepID=A0A1W1CE79_9ZZZZ